jgi:hypothetical protein
MNIPTDFPEDVRSKLQAVDLATQKQEALVKSYESQLTTEDIRKATALLGIESPKYDSKSTVAGLPATGTTSEETFFSKYKYFIIIGVVVIVIIGGVWFFKRKGK